MYHLAIRQFIRSLQNLDAVLGKAIAYATARKFEVNNFMTARLAPDMLPFAAQIRIACDTAKAAASGLSGKEAPKHEDNETTIDELRGRIAKCVAYLETFSPADFERTTPETVVKMPRNRSMQALDYLWGRQIPNFYFHVTTAYALLRAGGVDIGKTDFLGPLDIIDL